MTEPHQHLMVRSDVAADGAYQACVEVGEDRSIPLDRDRAQAYAMAVLTAVMHAEHDAAVLAQFTQAGMRQSLAGQTIADMRSKRQAVDDAATAPLRWLPGVSAFTGKGFLHLFVDGKAWCQLEPKDAVEHALYVLRTVTAADVDGVYFRYLTKDLSLPEDKARAMVAAVGSFYDSPRPDTEGGVDGD